MTGPSRSKLLTTVAAACLATTFAVGGALAADPVPQNDLLNATLWVTNSVEFKANAIGEYALAKIQLDKALADKTWTAATEQTGDFQDKPPAIILDADETVIDNGAYEAWLIKTGNDYSGKTWAAWVNDAEAKAVPGAVDFTKYADSKGVKVFYVTNRTADQEEATRKNMEALGFPRRTRFLRHLRRGEAATGRSLLLAAACGRSTAALAPDPPLSLRSAEDDGRGKSQSR